MFVKLNLGLQHFIQDVSFCIPGPGGATHCNDKGCILAK